MILVLNLGLLRPFDNINNIKITIIHNAKIKIWKKYNPGVYKCFYLKEYQVGECGKQYLKVEKPPKHSPPISIDNLYCVFALILMFIYTY